uniref:Uncharacterized protein n=1 Tax=Chromera velia CCMP2878 TaxID=1169474 RepID=A0A0G4HPY5_9ALVE|eukprot:Cvel_1242.t1-p1 / transcript=Cvel_1242.t1 / gene=Cvel_1242 / organism=Chromera_velia_CCMP2878 / gene_product=hypothetical protein / transcript_product=hypothetical protein / location=Cvel_scaffold41:127489-134487(-) / protein_length=1070 / sequence_SO=supercontig / SO=protein_coding / is_pseudo=false
MPSATFAKLRKAQRFYADVGVNSSEKAKTFLKALQCDFPVACPFTEGGVQKVSVYDPRTEEAEVVDVSEVSAESFFGGLSQQGNADESELLINQLRNIGYDPDRLAMMIHAPGDTFSVSLSATDLLEKKEVVLAVSRREPTYFDLGAAFKKGDSSWVWYAFNATSRDDLPQVSHSGDVNVGNFLIQTLRLGSPDGIPTDTPFCIYATGYNNHPIRRYKSIILMIREGDRMHAVPAPLDEATVGEAQGMVLLVGRRHGSRLLLKVLEVPVTGAFEVASGTSTLEPFLSQAIQSVPSPEDLPVARVGGQNGEGAAEGGGEEEVDFDPSAAAAAQRQISGPNVPSQCPTGSPLILVDSDVSDPLASRVFTLLESSLQKGSVDSLRVVLSGSTMAVLQKGEGGEDQNADVDMTGGGVVWTQTAHLVPDPVVHEGQCAVGSFTQTFAVAQLKQKQKIAGNVEKAKAMGTEEVAEFLSDNTEHSLVCVLRRAPLENAYRLARDDAFASTVLASLGTAEEGQAQHAAAGTLVDLPAADFCLDSFTFGCMLGLEGGTETRNHGLARAAGDTQASLATVFWRDNGLSALALPIVHEDWQRKFTGVDEANDPIIATLRILLRQSLVENSAAIQAVGARSIPPQHKEVGWLLVYIICKSIRTLCDRLTAIPATGDATAVAMRGLLWLLATTLASGSQPMSFAYNVFQNSAVRPGLPSKDFEWAIHATIARAMQYMSPHQDDSRFSISDMRKQLSRVLVRVLMKALLVPFLDPLRKAIVASKQDEKSREGHQKRVKHMNSEWYPRLQELHKLCIEAKALYDARDPDESKVVKRVAVRTALKERLEKLRDFFERPENHNRRARYKGVHRMLQRLDAHLAGNVQKKYAPGEAGTEPRYPGQVDWKIPGPGCVPPAPQGGAAAAAAAGITEGEEGAEDVETLPVADKAIQLVNAREGERLAALKTTILTALSTSQSDTDARTGLSSIAAVAGVPRVEWLREIAAGAGWGTSDGEVLESLRVVIDLVADEENWALGNDEVEVNAVRLIEGAFAMQSLDGVVATTGTGTGTGGEGETGAAAASSSSS